MSVTYRDTITVVAETSADGAEVPEYHGDLPGIPCKIRSLKGVETYRRRQLEARVDFVIETYLTARLLETNSRHRIEVTGGLWTGRVLNVSAVNPMDVDRGRPQLLEIFATERQPNAN